MQIAQDRQDRRKQTQEQSKATRGIDSSLFQHRIHTEGPNSCANPFTATENPDAQLSYGILPKRIATNTNKIRQRTGRRRERSKKRTPGEKEQRKSRAVVAFYAAATGSFFLVAVLGLAAALVSWCTSQ